MKDKPIPFCLVGLNDFYIASDFDCGVKELNDFLLQRAKREEAQRLSKTKIAISREEIILGFYTISPAVISKEVLEKSEGRGIPYSEVPAIRIGRLAVDTKYHNRGIGKALLKDALKTCLNLSNELGGHIVIVDAKDEKAALFYIQYGFKRVKSKPLNLVLKVSTIEKAL